MLALVMTWRRVSCEDCMDVKAKIALQQLTCHYLRWTEQIAGALSGLALLDVGRWDGPRQCWFWIPLAVLICKQSPWAQDMRIQNKQMKAN
jgi:hypothetical protein